MNPFNVGIAMPSRAGVFLFLAMICAAAPSVSVHGGEKNMRLAAGPPAETTHDATGDKDDEELSPAQKMQKRFPQPVRVGDVIGLPVLDENDSTIGYVRHVVRTADGKIVLIVPYSAWFGWAKTERGKRPVAVPIETVAILARQIIAIDMGRDDFDSATTWGASMGNILPNEEKTLIALGRR